MPVDLAQLADLPDVGSRAFKQPEQAVDEMFEEEEEEDNEMVGASRSKLICIGLGLD